VKDLVVKKYIKKLFLLAVTLIFLFFVFRNLDIYELLNVIKGFDIKYVFLLALSIIISLTFRGLCFQQLIYNTAKIPLKELSPLCITAASLNIVLPARAGDFFRAFYVGQKYNVDKIKIFGTVIFERIIDVFTIFCFLLFGVWFYNNNEIARKLCLVAGVCIVLGIILTVIALKFNKTDVICNFVIAKTQKLPFKNFLHRTINMLNGVCNSFCNGFDVINSPKHILFAVLSSIGIWAFECINYLIIIQGFGYQVHWSVSIFIISFIAMACMIPSTSIFIGPYQLAVITAFAMYNVNKETALAISFVEQAIVLITTSLIAVIFLIKNNISYKNLKENIENND
jgi:hypothetical protein